MQAGLRIAGLRKRFSVLLGVNKNVAIASLWVGISQAISLLSGFNDLCKRCVLCLVAQSCLAHCDPLDCSLPGSCVCGVLQARILEWFAMPSSRGSSQPRSPALRVDSLSPEPPGKPKNTEVGSLPVLQGNFPTQELNQCLLHCRWILYQLSYQGQPNKAGHFSEWTCLNCFLIHICKA